MTPIITVNDRLDRIEAILEESARRTAAWRAEQERARDRERVARDRERAEQIERNREYELRLADYEAQRDENERKYNERMAKYEADAEKREKRDAEYKKEREKQDAEYKKEREKQDAEYKKEREKQDAEYKKEREKRDAEYEKLRQENKAEHKQLRRESAQLSARIGRLVEDLVAPSIPRILKEVVGCTEEPTLEAVRVKRKMGGGQSREYDTIAICGEYMLVNETKSNMKPDDVKQFVARLQEIRDVLPGIEAYQVVGALATLYPDDSLVRFGEKNGLIMLGVGEGFLQVFNREGFQFKTF